MTIIAINTSITYLDIILYFERACYWCNRLLRNNNSSLSFVNRHLINIYMKMVKFDRIKPYCENVRNTAIHIILKPAAKTYLMTKLQLGIF